MKLYNSVIARFVFSLGVLALLPSMASAQFTLLPQPAQDADCKTLLVNFELTGVIPSIAVNKSNAAAGAQSDYQAAKQAYENAIVDPVTGVDCSATPDMSSCKNMEQKKQAMNDAQQKADNAQYDANKSKDDLTSERDNLLGCAVKTGRISLSMIPFFITYIANFMLGMIGLIVVLMIVIGGYQYVYGGLGDAKDKGKKTITYALMGMSLSLLAWVIVNVVIAAVTG